jgi:hypothetical protein
MKILGLIISGGLFYISTSALVVAVVFLLTPANSDDNIHLIKVCGYLLLMQGLVFYAATFFGTAQFYISDQIFFCSYKE